MGGGAGLGAWDNGFQRDERGYGDAKSTAYMATIKSDYPDYELGDGGERSMRLFIPPAKSKGSGKGVYSGELQEAGLWNNLTVVRKVKIKREAPEGSVYTGDSESVEILPLYDYDNVDARFQPEFENENCANDGTPTLLGATYLAVQTSKDDGKSRLLIPVKELIADHHGKDSKYSSAVYDTIQDGLDRRNNAGMHTAWWIKQNHAGNWAIAINGNKSKNDDTGYGFMAFGGDGAASESAVVLITPESESDDHETAPPIRLKVPGVPKDNRSDNTTLAYTSWMKYGNLHPGHSHDDHHKYGENEDGESINASHIWLKSYFYHSQTFDAPLLYEPVLSMRPVGGMPHRVPVHFQMDPTMKHDFEYGQKPGMHYWWAEALFDKPNPPVDIPTDQTTPPPTNNPPVLTPPQDSQNIGINWPGIPGRNNNVGVVNNAILPLKRTGRIKEANSPFQIGAPSFVARAESRTRDGQKYNGEWGDPKYAAVDYKISEIKKYDSDYGLDKSESYFPDDESYMVYSDRKEDQKYYLAPIVAHLNFLGKLDTTQKIWDYTESPDNSGFAGGTASGGIWVSPPEFSYNFDAPSTISDTYFGFHNSIKFGWGTPDNDHINNDGAIFSMTGSSGSRNLQLDFYDAAPAPRNGSLTINGSLIVTDYIKKPDNVPQIHGTDNDVEISWVNASGKLLFDFKNPSSMAYLTDYAEFNGEHLEVTSPGLNNCFIGKRSTRVLTGTGLTNGRNTGFGDYALGKLTTGYGNFAGGGFAGFNLTTGRENMAIGENAMYNATTSYRNAAIGRGSMFGMTTLAHDNVANGYSSLYTNQQGSRITALGSSALLLYNPGLLWADMVAIGFRAGYGGRTNRYGVYIGVDSGYNNNADGCIFIGNTAGYYETGANKLIIDRYSRTNEATARAESIIYGEMNTTLANQHLYTNANRHIPDDLYDYYGSSDDASIRFNGTGNVLEIDSPKTQIGDITAGDYTEIDDHGHLTKVGNATDWTDIDFSVFDAKTLGVNQPTETTFQGSINQYTFAMNDTIQLACSEIKHQYKDGTDLEPHVHMVLNGAQAGDEYVNWEIEYSIVVNGVYSNGTLTSGNILVPDGTDDRTEMIIDMSSAISGTNVEYGYGIILKVTRIALVGSPGNDLANDPFVTMVGVHIEQDKNGSDTEGT